MSGPSCQHLQHTLQRHRCAQSIRRNDAKVLEMEAQLQAARASAQAAQQQREHELEQHRQAQQQELAAVRSETESTLRTLQQMAGMLSAAAQQEEAARAQAAASQAVAANARDQRDMLAARLAEIHGGPPRGAHLVQGNGGTHGAPCCS